MDIWWNSLTSDHKLFWAAAIVSSMLFAIQIALVFLGGDTDMDADADAGGDMGTDADADADADADHAGSIFGYFTIRNLTAFFMGFGWGGLSMLQKSYDILPTTVVAVLVGLVFGFVVMVIMKGLSKLKDEGTISIANAVGTLGTVSITIPEEMKGAGKVSVVIQGRLSEVEAVTKSSEALTRGQQVKVEKVSGNKLIVTKPS